MGTTHENLSRRERIRKLSEEYEDRARIASLEADVDSYSTLAKVALGHVAALTTRNDQLQQQTRDLRDEIADLNAELRWLRGFLMDRDRAA
jgi:phage shock protein A